MAGGVRRPRVQAIPVTTMLTFGKFIRWLLHKFTTAIVMIVAAVLLFGVWIYVRDNADLEQWRQETVRAVTGRRAELHAALTDINAQLTQLAEQVSREQANLRQADKVIEGLRNLDSAWDRTLGNREQHSINRARLQSVTARRLAIEATLSELRQKHARTTWTRDGLEIALGKEDARLRKLESERSKAVSWLERTWNHEIGRGALRLPLKTWVLVALVGYFVGPTLTRLLLYFVAAPLAMRAKPVRLRAGMDAVPEIRDSVVAAEIALAPGERIWIKESFLQASDEGVGRNTRYLLDWRMPFTCLAAGLVELVEMTNKAAPETAPSQKVTLSNQADPHTELAVVTMPQGASLVLRPSFIAAVVVPAGGRLQVRRRWQLWRLQAWITLQFRFFEFQGPCRLVLAGSRGIRAEAMADREGPAVPARRTNQDATVGFTPNLEYRPVRAETFWSYYRGANPLFDDLFAGQGIFLCQQVAAPGEARAARRFWSGLWSGVLKVFGL